MPPKESTIEFACVNNNMEIKDFIPETWKKLTAYKGSELIDKIGENTVKEVVINILCGSNIRSLTGNLTRKRLALSNASLLMTYINASHSIQNLPEKLSQLVGDQLTNTKLTKEEKYYLQWLVGLTGKSIQNVLRGNNDEFIEYLNDLENSLAESAEEVKKIFGDLTGTMCIEDKKTNLSWPVITQIFMAIGAQTLAIRGSEKSIYGKLFEKFILGSLLTILGFDYTNVNAIEKDEMIFWLSERGDKRESDATALIKKGKAVRFDIGFIGSGNSEISLDKVSRFEKELELGGEKHFISTLIIVDRIGERSRITEMAKEIGGNIVQMSMALWVREVAQILHEKTDFNHEIIMMNDNDSLKFIREKMQKVNLKCFI